MGTIKGRILGDTKLGEGTFVAETAIIGHPGKHDKELLISGRENETNGSVLGENCVIRDYTIIYTDTKIGNRVQTGHHVLIREETEIGDNTIIGSGTIIEDNCKIGDRVSIQSGVYIPTNSIIEDDVFLGPRTCLTNDKYMGRGEINLIGAHIEKFARVGANSTILPGVRVGADSTIGSGAVVIKDVKPFDIVAGVPARKIGEVPQDHRRL